ncbi:MAG: V-type ATPase 116kDa subunit family protein [Coprothermobacterota bacterium]|nr:V-type ATPase 116kDa subunit family protein [Coprothermobacterota bacterium]
MIVRMRKLLLFGKKGLLPSLLNFLQDEGYFQVESIEENHLSQYSDTSEPQELVFLENQLAKVNSLISALGKFVPTPSPGSPLPLEELEDKIFELKNKITASEEELAFLNSYKKAIDSLLPLLKTVEESQRFSALGLVSSPRNQRELFKLRGDLNSVTGGNFQFQTKLVDEALLVAVVVYLRQDEQKVKAAVSLSGISELVLPSFVQGLSAREALMRIQKRLLELPPEIKKLKEQLNQIAQEQGYFLLKRKHELQDEIERKKAQFLAKSSNFLFLLAGWAPVGRVPQLEKKIVEKFGDQIILEKLELSEEDIHKAPVLLKNNRIFRPFQLLLGIFRPPRYDRIDPTPLVAIFYPLFFGLIIGDIGYGIVLLALFLLAFFRSKKETFRSVALIGTLCSAWTIIFGVLFGEFFGTLGESFGIHPILLDRMHDLTPFLIIALSLGVLQIFLGFFIEVYLSFKNHETKEGLEALFMVFWVSGALVLLFAIVGLLPGSVKQISTYLGLAFLLGGWVGIIVVRGPVMGVIEPLSVTGNILSYARLFGVGISAVYLAFAANTIGGLFSNIFIAVIITFIAHVIFFTLGIISPIVQSARLHFVEFFSKFKYHEHPGRVYKPLIKSERKGEQA